MSIWLVVVLSNVDVKITFVYQIIVILSHSKNILIHNTPINDFFSSFLAIILQVMNSN